MKSKFNKNYTWNYLQSSRANLLFETVADNIVKHNCKKILDLACGYSRINEFLDTDNYTIDGIETNNDCVEYCNENYSGKYVNFDALNFEKSELQSTYDCIIVSGFFYYAGKDGFPPMLEIFERLVKFYQPKIIIVTDPQPRIDHKSPDYSDLLFKYAYTVQPVYLDIRMGQRNVYTFFCDKPRPDFKIKANFNLDSIYNHYMADDYDNTKLKNGVYITNTENLHSDRDGALFPEDISCSRYISVAAGMKSIYKAAIDWYPGKKFEFVYVDIVPMALDYRIHLDRHVGSISFSEIYQLYVTNVNNNIIPMFGNNDQDIDKVINDQVEELGLTAHWKDFLYAYSISPKTYIRLDVMNNVKLFNSLAKNDTETWFWYSNIPDWHQFRQSEKTFNRWKKYLNDRNRNIVFSGKTPPFTSS